MADLSIIVAASAGLAAGLILGGLLAWLWSSARLRAETQAKLIDAAERTQRAEASVEELRKQAEGERAELARLRDDLSGAQQARTAADTRSEEALKSLQEQKALLSEARSEMAEAFKALSGEALKTNNEAFLALARTSFERLHAEAKGDLSQRQQAIDEMVKPLQEALSRYESQIHLLEQSRQSAYGGLDQHLKSLAESHQKLQQETGNLVKALRAPTVRGRWGEITLKRVAELAGMVEHCDFTEQVSVEGEEGRLRPDMVVHLPGDRQIIVDAKAVLSAYLEAHAEQDETQRLALLRQHAAQVRSRMEDLSAKAYWSQFPQAPKYVVLFLPGEQYLGAALEQDPKLIEDGLARSVLIATPTTLIALLHAGAYGWRQEQLSEHAQQAGRLGKDLYDRMAVLTEHLDDIGQSLAKSVQAYNKAVGSIETRVLPAARKFKELGIASDKDLPRLEPIDSVPRSAPTSE
ncbi:MAG: DNA recombination protein RmuC [Nitrospirota bacterium]|nr:DNA recombination protein RmuC [Nitrospirota bacterium]MDE3118763.1 DNA recombination protein RmuC [Nitrospirota bacterium]MDE3241732.1 DNA recombination protein RmuC [Nitrospirota bacterium]